MDELIKQGQWWWLLVVPVATGGFALFGSWWGSRLGKTTEHEQWLRNEKVETYSQYVESLRRLDHLLSSVIIGAMSLDDALKSDFTGASRLRLISPKSVREAAMDHNKSRQAVVQFLLGSSKEDSQAPAFNDAVNRLDEARSHLTEIMRRDLSITDR
ncbi:hypothetical protein AB4068_00845 [Arthrobacter sp. 2RAF22]|uniref:hypothetical protein n=1 Tax=Arthrobacter sp. 2RAF22 TaxID=3232996 RepID=UPI003F93692C